MEPRYCASTRAVQDRAERERAVECMYTVHFIRLLDAKTVLHAFIVSDQRYYRRLASLGPLAGQPPS